MHLRKLNVNAKCVSFELYHLSLFGTYFVSNDFYFFVLFKIQLVILDDLNTNILNSAKSFASLKKFRGFFPYKICHQLKRYRITKISLIPK